MFDLTGKRALVTGASGGIGKGIAVAMSNAGAELVLSGRRKDALDALAAELPGKTHVITCNLGDLAEVDALGPAAEAAMGGVDILVNNAGMTRDNLFMRMKDEEWDDVIAVNLTAAFHLTRSLLRGMMKQRSGRIINVASVVGLMGHAGQANYAASKAGIMAMGKSLAQEVAQRGITVNTIAPGFIVSAMTDVLNEKQHEAILEAVPMGRMGTADEIAAAAVFLASDAAGYITGHTLNVNGGMAMI